MAYQDSPATRIRRDLKAELGLTARQVSVRSSRCSSVDVTIKAPGIKVKDVEAVARRQERYERDRMTGCILRGGNTFVFVDMSCKLTDDLVPQIQEWLETLEESNVLQSVPSSSDLMVSRENKYRYLLWKRDDSRAVGEDNSYGMARRIARRFVEIGRMDFKA